VKFAYFSHVWGRPGQTPGQRYEELWREVELAEELDFDFAFSVEHHFTPQESWMPSPALFCTGAGMRTSRIRIGPMRYVPPLHHPLRIAEEVAALDQLLGGRLEVGLAAGVTPDFFGPYGADFGQRRELTRECAELIRTALPDGGPFDFAGPAHPLADVRLSFGSVQRPHPPLWVPTTNRATLRYLASIGAHTSATMLLPRSMLGLVYRHYVDWWQAAGHAGRPNIGYWTLVHVAPTDEEAMDRAFPQIVHTLTKTLGYGQADTGRAGAPVAGPAGLNTAQILEHAGDISFLRQHNLVFVGSPDTVIGQIRRAAAEGCFNTLLAELNFGWMTEQEVASAAKLFAAEVMPALRAYEPYPPAPNPPAGNSPAPSQPAPSQDVYSTAEADLIAQRLEALGYID
jgi:alkanesulfonate monooxygenase SsuD/methylene tetrahydromethanopterin reductase-like flavin-dependent oxidoreductase (luciferase family)